MPKTDSSVHNQKVFVTLEAVMQLQTELDWIKSQFKDELMEAKKGTESALKNPRTNYFAGMKNGMDWVVKVLSLPRNTPTDGGSTDDSLPDWEQRFGDENAI